jgi:hypothetical protein
LSGEVDEVAAEEDGEVLLGTGDTFEGEPEAALLGGDQSESDPSSAV